jgi:secreted trypsin-like serine protease
MIRRTGALLLLLISAASLAAVPAASAAPEQADTSIVKGPPAPIESLPWLAKIGYRDLLGETGECTGTVVAPRVVLTAGHCVHNLLRGGINRAAGYAVLTGIADVSTATRADVSRVSRVLMFPGYDPRTVRRDAGLLILSAPVSAPSLPLAGPADAALLAPGTPLTVAGWGTTEGEAPVASPVLRWGEVAVQGTPTCRKGAEPSGIKFFAATEFCTKAPPRFQLITCHGDSGGPAIARRADGSLVQVGIISKGHALCKPKLPDYLTRVDAVSAWVGEWIAAVEGGGPPPKVEIPTVRLPRMAPPEARDFAGFVLAVEYGLRFVSPNFSCDRLGKASFDCKVDWRWGPNNYSGHVTVSYVLRTEGIFAAYRYRVTQTNPSCDSCRSNTRTGAGLE